MKKSPLQFLQKNLASLPFALCFCLPVYSGALLLHYGLETPYIILNSFLAPLAMWAFLKLPRALRFHFGFYVGLLLFYWVALSFRFSPLPWLLPFVMLVVALIYSLILGLLLSLQWVYFRVFVLLVLGFIHPFGFDWLLPEAFFSYSVFGVDKFSFACALLGLVMIFFSPRKKQARGQWGQVWEPSSWGRSLARRTLGVVFLALACAQSELLPARTPLSSALTTALEVLPSSLAHQVRPLLPKSPQDSTPLHSAPLDFALTQTAIPQSLRWSPATFERIITQNLALIDAAIDEGKEAIILPETAFPTFLHQRPDLMQALRQRSERIAIITGALRKGEAGRIFNSTYIFQHTEAQILDKVILAPFGERIPLPDFLAKPLQKLFFNHSDAFTPAPMPQDFTLNGITFRNAICYEGTSSLLYASSPRFVIVISNNAWFYPSIEPALQQMLLKYYARITPSLILHSANFSHSMRITPNLFD